MYVLFLTMFKCVIVYIHAYECCIGIWMYEYMYNSVKLYVCVGMYKFVCACMCMFGFVIYVDFYVCVCVTLTLNIPRN